VVVYDVQIIWRTLPATVLTLVAGVGCFSALGLAVAAVAPSSQAAMAMTTGLTVPLSFVSDIFAVEVTSLPRWLDALGWFFPLRHLVNALGDATNPFLEGSGLYPDHLAVMAAWGLAGALVASRRLRLEPRRARTARGTRTRVTSSRGPSESAGSTGAVSAPQRTTAERPSSMRLLLNEIRHADALLWRDPGSTFFAVAFPVLLVLLVPQIYGADAVLDNGTPCRASTPRRWRSTAPR
jgi:hypothetical protein